MTASTYAALRVAALQIRNEHADNANTAIRVGDLFTGVLDSLQPVFPVNGLGADGATNTGLIQQAIDAAHAAYVAGSGPCDVVIPTMNPLPLAASTSSEIFWNYGVQVPATDGCIAMRSGVRLRGAGVGNTVLVPASPTLDAVHWVDGSDSLIEGIEIDGKWVAAGAGHAILQVTSANVPMTVVDNMVLRDVYCHDVGSYGLGLQNGEFLNVRVENFRSKNTGADGIDIKNRPGNTNDSKGIVLDGILVDSPGMRLDTQTGVDIRGICLANNITVVNVGRVGATVTGIRFRVYALDEGGADYSLLSNFYVRAASGSYDVYGIDCGADYVKISNGETFACRTGVWMGGNHGVVANVIARSSTVRGFIAASTYTHNSFANCRAIGCLVGFEDQGTYSTFAVCDGLSSTTPISTAGGGTLRTQQQAGNQFFDEHAYFSWATAGRADITCQGSPADINLYLEPKGTNGRVQFGTRTASGDVPVTGYIEVRDAGGTLRRLAVVG